jgi:L-arabinonolactonase
MHVDRVETDRCALGEGALWDPEVQALYFLDILGKKVLRYDPDTGETARWDLPERVGAMGLRDGGGAILALTDSLYAFDFSDGACRKIAGPVFDNPNVVLNDGAVDRRGRFVFGSCDVDLEASRPVGGLFGLDREHRIVVHHEGVHQSNSHCFSPDGKTLYCADSFLGTAYAYDYDLDTGAVSNKRIFVNTEELGGVPDGSTVDADGLVWMSICAAGKIAAFRPDGKLERVVEVPVALVSSVAWGGPAFDRLYVTTIDPVHFGRPAEDGAGHVYVFDDLGCRGLPEPRFAS